VSAALIHFAVAGQSYQYSLDPRRQHPQNTGLKLRLQNNERMIPALDSREPDHLPNNLERELTNVHKKPSTLGYSGRHI
jgi:hypothetical protein